jgi:hypothetical protein
VTMQRLASTDEHGRQHGRASTDTSAETPFSSTGSLECRDEAADGFPRIPRTSSINRVGESPLQALSSEPMHGPESGCPQQDAAEAAMQAPLPSLCMHQHEDEGSMPAPSAAWLEGAASSGRGGG